MSVLVTPAAYRVQNLTEFSAVVVRTNGGRLRVVNNPSIAYFPVAGGITVRGKSDKTVKSSHPDAAIVTYYKDGKVVAPSARPHASILASVEWLDGLVPDWHTRVNVDDLYMMSGFRCVLGQVFSREGAESGRSGYAYALKWHEAGAAAFANYREHWVALIQSRQAL